MKQCYSCVCVALALVYTAVALCPANEACVTELGNIARYRNITTNSTCGRNFCEESLCTDCSNTTSYHGIDNINDGRNDTWWESDRGAMNIIIQIDLEAAMIFDSTWILWQSSRPMSMVIDRSSDFGQTWVPYRFFSSQCSRTFGMPQYNQFVQGMPPNSTEAICLAEESTIAPLTNGVVTFSINDQVAPGILNSQELLEYQTVTNLRLRLVEHFTILGEDYFAIHEWSITGTCLCNGHGMCSPVTGDTVEGKIHAGCDCVHNTDGSHCEVCQPLYNNATWMAASGSEVNACQMCNCNMHASSCVYDEAQGQGVCNCQDNTDGPMCETCQPGYYVDQTMLQTNPNVCIPCGCDPRGTVGGADNCNVTSGQCSCKTNVVNSFCSSCAVGFYNLTETNPEGCQACDCESRGSLGCDETGVCMCKENVIPPDCSQCMDGFTGLSSVTASCEPCNCNPSGSTTLVCDKDLGTCSCIPNVVNLLCDTPAGGYYVKALDNVKFEAEMANFVNGTTVVYPLSNTGLLHTGRGFAQIGSGEGVQFTLSVEMSSTYEVTVRYWTMDPTASVTLMIESQVPVDMALDCSSLDPSSSTSGNFLSSLPSSPDGTTNSYHVLIPAICLQAGVQYTASLSYAGSGEILVDSFVLIPNFNLTSQIYDSLDVTLRGECTPRMLISTIPIVCNDITFTLSVEFYRQVFPCDCDEIGSLVMDPECRKYGGSCYCKTGVTGERCDRCLNGYYNLTQAGCSACGHESRKTVGGVDNCGVTNGQCPVKLSIGVFYTMLVPFFIFYVH